MLPKRFFSFRSIIYSNSTWMVAYKNMRTKYINKTKVMYLQTALINISLTHFHFSILNAYRKSLCMTVKYWGFGMVKMANAFLYIPILNTIKFINYIDDANIYFFYLPDLWRCLETTYILEIIRSAIFNKEALVIIIYVKKFTKRFRI